MELILRNPLKFACALVFTSLIPNLLMAQSQPAQMTQLERNIASAVSIGGPSFTDAAEINRDLIQQGRCAAYAIQPVSAAVAGGEAQILTTAYEGDCQSGGGGVVITLHKQVAPTLWQIENLWTIHSHHRSAPQKAGSTGFQSDEIMAFQAKFQRDQLAPFPASKLPAWEAGKVIPNLPLGVEWEDGMERELYEAVRAGGYPVFCAYDLKMTCFADLPGRKTRTKPLLVTNGYWNVYETETSQAALDVMLGKTPSITASALAAKEKAMNMQVDAMAKGLISGKINKRPSPEPRPTSSKAGSASKAAAPVKP